jgi:hypothetical protein
MGAPLLYCSVLKENSMLVLEFLVRHGEHSGNSSHKVPPPPTRAILRQLCGPKKFVRLGGDFQKWKNKRHSPGMSRTVSTEENFGNVEEFIRIVGGVTVDEIAEKFGLIRGSVRRIIHKNL